MTYYLLLGFQPGVALPNGMTDCEIRMYKNSYGLQRHLPNSDLITFFFAKNECSRLQVSNLSIKIALIYQLAESDRNVIQSQLLIKKLYVLDFDILFFTAINSKHFGKLFNFKNLIIN